MKMASALENFNFEFMISDSKYDKIELWQTKQATKNPAEALDQLYNWRYFN